MWSFFALCRSSDLRKLRPAFLVPALASQFSVSSQWSIILLPNSGFSPALFSLLGVCSPSLAHFKAASSPTSHPSPGKPVLLTTGWGRCFFSRLPQHPGTSLTRHVPWWVLFSQRALRFPLGSLSSTEHVLETQ